MRFNFVGEFDIAKEDAKVPGYSDGKTKNGDKYLRVNPICIAAKNNRAYCEAFGVKSDPIKTKDKDGNDIEIEYADANDKDVIENVAFYRKHVIDGDERFETASDFNFCQQIWIGKEEYKGKRFLFTGNIKKNIYNGKISDRFQVSNMYMLGEDDERKNALEVNAEFFWTKDGVDTADFKDEKKLYIDGYTREYVNDKDKVKNSDPDYQYFPLRVVFDCRKVDFDNEKHVKAFKFRLGQLGLTYDEGKIGYKIKKGKVYKNEVTLTYNRGAEEVEWDESQLTDTQKEAIELGLKKASDFAPKGQSYGNAVIEYKLRGFTLNGDYTDGYVELEDSWSDFEESIYLPVATKEEEEAFEKAVNPPAEEKEKKSDDDDDNEIDDSDLDDLFD